MRIGGQNLLRLSRRTARHGQRGATAVEFALIAPFYFLLIIGIMESAMVMFAQHVLECAAANGSRTGKTGYVGGSQTQAQTIADTVNKMAGFIMDSSKISITATAYKSLSAIGTGEPFIDANGNGKWDTGENFTDTNGNGKYDSDIGAAGYGNAGDIVVYTVTYPWPIMTPIMQNVLGKDGVMNLQSRIVVKNEPYG